MQKLNDLSELVELSEKHGLYLKPISRINITVQLPALNDPNRSISNWDIMEKLKRLINPIHFSCIKVVKSCVEYVRFEADLNNRDLMQKCLSGLDNAQIKMTGFFDAFKIKVAECDSHSSTKQHWETYFRDAPNFDGTKPGERADTVYIQRLPCKWFRDENDTEQQRFFHAERPCDDECKKRCSKFPSEEMVRKVFECFGQVRCVDVPMLDPAASCHQRNKFSFDAKGDVVTMDAPMASDENFHLTFDAYVQYIDYFGFVNAMQKLHNMRLVHVSSSCNKSLKKEAYCANILVDFDRSKRLSDKHIRRRRLIREKFFIDEKERLNKLEKEKEIYNRGQEEERLKTDLTKRYLEKEKTDRLRQREEKRKLKHLQEKRDYEAQRLERRIEREQRKLLIAQRKLQSIRLLSALFQMIKPSKSAEKVEQALKDLESAQEEDRRAKVRSRLKRNDEKQRLLKEKEKTLRERMLKKFSQKLQQKHSLS